MKTAQFARLLVLATIAFASVFASSACSSKTEEAPAAPGDTNDAGGGGTPNGGATPKACDYLTKDLANAIVTGELREPAFANESGTQSSCVWSSATEAVNAVTLVILPKRTFGCSEKQYGKPVADVGSCTTPPCACFYADDPRVGAPYMEAYAGAWSLNLGSTKGTEANLKATMASVIAKLPK